MRPFVSLARKAVELRFKVFGLKIIENIPTELFQNIIKVKLSGGWNKSYEYNGFDAWIDFGKIVLEKQGEELKFEWDNWTEGEITGKANEIDSIANIFSLSSKRSPTWFQHHT